ncbi:MAG: TolC family protein [Pseudomonadota bacterium]
MTRIHSVVALAVVTAFIPLPSMAADPVPPRPDLSVAEVVTAAIDNHPEQSVYTAEYRHAEAMGKRARSFLDDAPSVGFSHQTDALGSDTGMREWEGSVELPLRLPGLKAAAERQAESASSLAERGDTRWRLQVAGQIRSLLARLAEADETVRLAEKAVKTAEKLQAQVQRRLELGDVPRTDLILAREETLKRRAEARQARLTRSRLAEEYRGITGLDARPADWREEPADRDSLERHPDLLAADASVQVGEAKRAMVRERGKPQPTVGMNVRREEDGRDSIDSVGVSVSVPLTLGSLRAPERSGAERDLAQARSQAAVTERRLRIALRQAEKALAAARQEREMALEHRDLAEESLALAQRAYALGETDLADLLRVRSRTLAAERLAAMSRIRLARTIAEYNQAKGIMP